MAGLMKEFAVTFVFHNNAEIKITMTHLNIEEMKAAVQLELKAPSFWVQRHRGESILIQSSNVLYVKVIDPSDSPDQNTYLPSRSR